MWVKVKEEAFYRQKLNSKFMAIFALPLHLNFNFFCSKQTRNYKFLSCERRLKNILNFVKFSRNM